MEVSVASRLSNLIVQSNVTGHHDKWINYTLSGSYLVLCLWQDGRCSCLNLSVCFISWLWRELVQFIPLFWSSEVIGLEPRALPMLSKLSTMELHVPSLRETFEKDPLLSFLETYPFGCDPPKAEPPKRHKTHLYFFVCVLFLCLLMVLPQAQSRQSFPATELLLCFLCNMSNLTRGMHVVWLWLISVWDYRRCSALVWHWSFFSWILRHLFHNGQSVQGWGQLMPDDCTHRQGDRKQHPRERSSYGWTGVCNLVTDVGKGAWQVLDFLQLFSRVLTLPSVLWQTIYHYKSVFILKCLRQLQVDCERR